MEIPAPFEIGRLVHAVKCLHDQILERLQQTFELVAAPQVIKTLLSFGVRIQRGVKPTIRVAHFPQQPAGRFPGGLSEQPVGSDAQGVGVEAEQLGVVVEHLFEVGDHPLPIGGVTEEAAADVIIDAAARHPGQGGHHHVQTLAVAIGRGPVPQHPGKRARHRKLGRAAEPAFGTVVLRLEVRLQALDQGAIRFGALVGLQSLQGFDLGRVARMFDLLEHLRETIALFVELFATRGVGFVDPHEQIDEPGQLMPRRLRKIGAAEKGHEGLRIQEHGQRPAARLLSENLVGQLIDLVEIGAFFPIHLDVHEVFVHHTGGRRVFERFVCHHVAPVTARISDRQQDGFTRFSRSCEGSFIPGLPVNGIVGVLLEIRAGLPGEAVAH